MIKLIAIDLDGTMYTSRKEITQRVKNAINMARKNEVQPVIVTGRGRMGAETALQKLGMDLPYICAAGSLVRSGLHGNTMYTKSFYEETLLERIIKFTNKNNTALLAEPLNGPPYWYGPDSTEDLLDKQTLNETTQSVRSYRPEVDFNQPMLKLTIVAKPEQLSEMETIIRDDHPNIHQVYSGAQFIDLTADGANKGTALQFFSEYHNLLPDEVAAIGDQPIDIHMLRYAGLPIAMQNGVEEVHQAAKWIAPGNDEDGVAWAIEEILKQNHALL